MRKRLYQEVDNRHWVDEVPPLKRIKYNSIEQIIGYKPLVDCYAKYEPEWTSRYMCQLLKARRKHEDYYFQCIYKILIQLPLINQLNFPSYITRVIAQYSSQTFIGCINYSYCQNVIPRSYISYRPLSQAYVRVSQPTDYGMCQSCFERQYKDYQCNNPICKNEISQLTSVYICC